MNTYIIKGKRDGYLELSYREGYLNELKLAFKEVLNEGAFYRLLASLPYEEHRLAGWIESTGLKMEKQLANNERIALFCRLYENKTGVKYKVSPADGGKMKGLKLSNELLACYFASENFLFKNKYSIGNLTKYYNELCVELANVGKSSYPNHWSEAFENKLKGKELASYWAHLRNLGLTPKKDRLGRTVEWVTPNPQRGN